jgi:hypothetical protein
MRMLISTPLCFSRRSRAWRNALQYESSTKLRKTIGPRRLYIFQRWIPIQRPKLSKKNISSRVQDSVRRSPEHPSVLQCVANSPIKSSGDDTSLPFGDKKKRKKTDSSPAAARR